MAPNLLTALDPDSTVAERHVSVFHHGPQCELIDNLEIFRGHESLSIIFRYAQILLSVLDPGALVAEPHRLRLPPPHASKTLCLLN